MVASTLNECSGCCLVVDNNIVHALTFALWVHRHPLKLCWDSVIIFRLGLALDNIKAAQQESSTQSIPGRAQALASLRLADERRMGCIRQFLSPNLNCKPGTGCIVSQWSP